LKVFEIKTTTNNLAFVWPVRPNMNANFGSTSCLSVVSMEIGLFVWWFFRGFDIFFTKK